jgi:hypothetical protein
MKTRDYNPSIFEVQVANALVSLQSAFNEQLENCEITEFTKETQGDNPNVVMHLRDNDGDRHEVVIRIIQRPDGRI